MNKHQLKDFIYTVSDTVYNNWLDHATDEQLELADEIFREANQSHVVTSTKIEDLSLANSYLKQFTLTGK